MTINCNGKLICLKKAKVMGILNITPDSFSDGGKFNSINSALFQTEKMLQEGADFIDIGGQSSRPGADFLNAEDECKRVLPFIENILKRFPDTLISIDTFWSSVAKKAVNLGACIINDISAGSIDSNMFNIVSELNVPYILMHMQGTPKNMQKNPLYNNLRQDIQLFFSKKVNSLRALGVNDIILDLGYGFGKTLEQNYELLSIQKDLFFGEFPILTGVSRKSMIYKLLNTTPQQALNGTSAIHMLSLINNASILRVHDVKEAKECIKIFEEYKANQ